MKAIDTHTWPRCYVDPSCTGSPSPILESCSRPPYHCPNTNTGTEPAAPQRCPMILTPLNPIGTQCARQSGRTPCLYYAQRSQYRSWHMEPRCDVSSVVALARALLGSTSQRTPATPPSGPLSDGLTLLHSSCPRHSFARLQGHALEFTRARGRQSATPSEHLIHVQHASQSSSLRLWRASKPVEATRGTRLADAFAEPRKSSQFPARHISPLGTPIALGRFNKTQCALLQPCLRLSSLVF